MKKQKLILLVIGLCMKLTIHAATDKNTYEFKVDLNLHESNIHGDTLGDFKGLVTDFTAGLKFYVVNVLSDGSKVIRLLPWSSKVKKDTTGKRSLDNLNKNEKFVYDKSKVPNTDDKIAHRKNVYDSPDYKPRFFLLPVANMTKDIDTVVRIYQFTYVNVSSLPGKLRFGAVGKQVHLFPSGDTINRRFDVTSGINVGYSMGLKFGLNQRTANNCFLSILGGFNVSTVSVDSATTDGKASNNNKTLASITPTFGVLFEFKQFQLGLFTGIDFLTGAGDVARSWVYRNQPWLGVGIGVSIFGNTNSTTQTQN
jgi:hypothetical protein